MKIKDIAWENGMRVGHQYAIYGDISLHVESKNGKREWYTWTEPDVISQCGESPAEPEAKAAATVAAWCHANGVEWSENYMEWAMLHDERGFYVSQSINGHFYWDFGKPMGYFTVGESAASGESQTLPEAQLAAIMAYEEWRSGK